MQGRQQSSTALRLTDGCTRWLLPRMKGTYCMWEECRSQSWSHKDCSVHIHCTVACQHCCTPALLVDSSVLTAMLFVDYG
jgi:hypothetical protein